LPDSVDLFGGGAQEDAQGVVAEEELAGEGPELAAGLIKPEVAPTWVNVFALLAAQTGDPEDLDLPLVFAKGRMSLGPLPLGPAPRMN